jgi:predicted helicase
MKANLLLLTLLTLATSAYASEKLVFEDGHPVFVAYNNPDFQKNGEVAVAENEKDMKIATLNKLLDQQQRLYEEKISYLQDELRKSKERLIEKSINQEKMQAFQEKHFNEETGYLKKELVAKTKTLMEYQRQLEKIKPSEEVKNLIKANTELAIELRRSTDQIALFHLKGNDILANKPIEDKAVTGGRMPASVGK